MAALFWVARVWELGDAVRDFGLWAIPVVLALNLPVLAVMVLRSWVVLRRMDVATTPGPLVGITSVGYLAGQLTPANAGDLWRAYAYRREWGLPVGRGAAAVVYERGMSFYLMALGAGAIALYQVALSEVGFVAVPAIGAALVALAFVPSLVYPTLDRVGERMGRGISTPAVFNWGPLRSLLVAVREGSPVLRGLFLDRFLCWTFLGATVAYLCLSTLQLWFITEALGLGLGLHEVWFALSVGATAGALSSLPLGLGVTDGGVVIILRTLGVTLTSASAAAILMRGLQTLPLGLVAVASYAVMHRGRDRKSAQASKAVVQEGVR
jgi:uncharacterized protein (TIRG00374 family)